MQQLWVGIHPLLPPLPRRKVIQGGSVHGHAPGTACGQAASRLSGPNRRVFGGVPLTLVACGCAANGRNPQSGLRQIAPAGPAAERIRRSR
jgi:hypothetical protein